jgi:hypothetical protein
MTGVNTTGADNPRRCVLHRERINIIIERRFSEPTVTGVWRQRRTDAGGDSASLLFTQPSALSTWRKPALAAVKSSHQQ